MSEQIREMAFRHTFYPVEFASDTCAWCGLDLRDLVHRQYGSCLPATPIELAMNYYLGRYGQPSQRETFYAPPAPEESPDA